MAYTAPTVNYSATMNGTYTTLTGVQNVRFNRGRQRFMDPFPPTSCTIELIPANSYSLPLAIGQFIDIRQTNSSGSEAYFVGQITDVYRAYDFPYNSGTGAAPGDRIIITALGPVGLIGRGQFVNATLSVIEANIIARNLFSAAAAAYFNTAAGYLTGTTFDRSIQDGFTTSSPPLDVFNEIARTDPFYFSDRDNARIVYSNSNTGAAGYAPGYGPMPFGINIIGQKTVDESAFAFTDSAGSYKFNAVEYGASSQNSFTQVIVHTDNTGGTGGSPPYTDQSVVSGYSPLNGLDWSTFGTSNDAALVMANYVFTRSYSPTPVPFSVTTSTVVDDTCTTLAKMNTVKPGQRGTVTFRGSTYRVTLEGIEVTFTPDRMSVTAYFSPFPLNYFILDSTSNGVLDTNVLGYP